MGGGKAPEPGRPTPRQEAPPTGTLVPPPQHAKPAGKSARGGVGDGSSRPHAPRGERAALSEVGVDWTGPPPPPPQASQKEHGTEAGQTEGHGPRGTALPAPSTGTARGARATPTRRGGGARTPRERERRHTQGTRRTIQNGNRTEAAERTGRMEWRTSERG